MAHEIASKALVCDVVVERGESFDVYTPRGEHASGAVLIANGYPAEGFVRHVGCAFNEMQSVISWAQLIASHGLVAVAANDPRAALAYMRGKYDRMALWACSGHAPLALTLLGEESFAGAVLLYPMLTSRVAQTSVCAPPLFIVRCGRDENPGLNDALESFVADAIASNVDLTLINHAEAPHAFDLVHDSERSRAIVRATLSFLRDIMRRA